MRNSKKAAIIVESPFCRRFDDCKEETAVTGPELKQLRQDLGEAIGRPLSAADMAKLCGLDQQEGADTIRRWEVTGRAGPPASSWASSQWPAIAIQSWRISIFSTAGT